MQLPATQIKTIFLQFKRLFLDQSNFSDIVIHV